MIKAFKFGMLDPVSGFDQTALDTLYLRNKLWNALVELERGHREKYRALLTGSNEYALIRVEDMQLKKLAEVKREDGKDNPMPQTVRKNRTRAALYEMTLCIQQAAAKTGAEVEKMPAMNSTIVCSECGHLNASMDKEDIYFRCGKCDTLHDQDENAAKNFLRGHDFYQAAQMVA